MTYEFTKTLPARDDGIEPRFRFGGQQSFEQSYLFVNIVVVEVCSGLKQ